MLWVTMSGSTGTGVAPHSVTASQVAIKVLEGTITLQADGGPPREYKPGQAYIEDINHWHQAFNKTSSATKILVVFAGVQGKPTTIAAQ